MNVMRWHGSTRERLIEALPEGLVILPVGAIEQHGPHLPTGTDTLIVQAVVEAAVAQASERCPRQLIITPPVAFGSSDHHLPFGGTLSLTFETFTQVLLDLVRSIAMGGGRRVVLVNGHGGNKGPCHSVAEAAAIRFDLSVGYADYWDLFPAEAGGNSPLVPGHAGVFETAMLLALREELVEERPGARAVSELQAMTGITLHSRERWRRIDGYTDEPGRASAEKGRRWLDACAAALADRLLLLSKTL
ncbi:hypothetical protein UA75_10835 [Actinoalloteichus sp. GBA129-24]|uniref:Creatininase n=2 Tax=Pseudonocardiaceae TaxID=2070 RepID=A0AAC9PRN7_9PSEU|nr:hypothetical protein UA74_10750 [Actinoalloteichus fjordicus]APU20179.1 hypothetical protein UA75_10835 [Actinoalloteichus sp. GBA129-24]